MSLTSVLFTGSSGLQANSEDLDVVGNNLANMSTTGYKDQTTSFKDVVYQTLNPGSGPTATLGGTNPVQTGFGVTVGATSTNFSQGGITPTGNSQDAAIQGNGFFVLSSGTGLNYSRNGAFSVNSAGFLVDPNTGDLVQRTGTVGEGTATTPGFQVPGNNNILIPIGTGIPGTATANVTLQGNIDSQTALNGTVNASIQVYDSQGTAESLDLTFTNTGSNTYTASATISGGTATVTGNPVTFDQNGLLVSPSTLAVAVTGIPGAAAQTINLNLGTPGDANGLTQTGGASTANAVSQDGAASGTLTSVSFDQSGTIQGSFTNGQTLPIAQLAIASFNNQSGLLLQGNNYFAASAASGSALVGTAGSGGLGTVQGGSLEGSNVDISTEFSQLIIAQRGFQINAQTVTVADQTLQTLAGIISQG